MEPDAAAGVATPIRDGHVDRRARAGPELPEGDGSAMARHGAGPIGEDGGHAATVPREDGVANGIDAKPDPAEQAPRSSRSPGLSEARISGLRKPGPSWTARWHRHTRSGAYERYRSVSGGGRFCPGVRGTTFRCLLRVFPSESDLGVRVGRSEGHVTGAIPSCSCPPRAKGPAREVSPLAEAASPGRGLPGATPSRYLGEGELVRVRTYWFPGEFYEANPGSSTRYTGTIQLHVEASTPPYCHS